MTNPKAVASLLQIAPFISLLLLAIFPYPILSTKSFQAFDFLQQQLNYHLKATGKLDAQTVKQMRMPRCGVPDIVNGKTSMRSGKKKHTNGGNSSSLHSVSLYSFFQGSPRWQDSKSHLTYQFSSTIPVTDLKTLKTVSKRAFARWAEVSHFKFSEATDEAADIVIGFYSGDHGDGSSFDGPGGTLAHSFSPTDGRLHFDAEENWSTNPKQDMMDIETVAVHEIGHLLGLEHSSEPKAIMYPIILFGSQKRKLHGDDVQAELFGFMFDKYPDLGFFSTPCCSSLSSSCRSLFASVNFNKKCRPTHPTLHITLKSMISKFKQAFARCAEVSTFKFSEAIDEADIVIGFYSGDHGDGSSFDGPVGLLAHSFSPTDERLHFNAEENWSINPGKT